MRIAIIEGEAGCTAARDQQAVAVIVDALRASATVAALLSCGAREIWVARTVDEARRAKQFWPDALLYGERGGLPPEGFDFGNSPLEAPAAKGRRIIFTTTTGAGRMVSAWGAAEVLMGTTLNGAALVRHLQEQKHKHIIFIPAGLMEDPNFNALEDWTAAAYLARTVCMNNHNEEIIWGAGYDRYQSLVHQMAVHGIPQLFSTAPHADKLRAIGKEADIAFCAQCDIYDAVPKAIAKNKLGVIVAYNGSKKT